MLRRSLSSLGLLMLPIAAFVIAYGLGRLEEYAYILFVYPMFIGLLIGAVAAAWVYMARVTQLQMTIALIGTLTLVASGGFHLGRYDAARAVFDELYMAGAAETLLLDGDVQEFQEGSGEHTSVYPSQEHLDKEWDDFLFRETGEEGIAGYVSLRAELGIRTHALSALPVSASWVRFIWAVELLLLGGVLGQLVWGIRGTPLCRKCGDWLQLKNIGRFASPQERDGITEALKDNDFEKAMTYLARSAQGIASAKARFILQEETCRCSPGVASILIMDANGLCVDRHKVNSEQAGQT